MLVTLTRTGPASGIILPIVRGAASAIPPVHARKNRGIRNLARRVRVSFVTIGVLLIKALLCKKPGRMAPAGVLLSCY
jgi:hypothetical protein